MAITSAAQATDTKEPEDTKIKSVAREIEEYFDTHPDAGDTLEGIADWWVSRQRLRDEKSLIRAALAHLVTEGVLQKRHHGGREIYMRNGSA
jgi:hypothetical protein